MHKASRATLYLLYIYSRTCSLVYNCRCIYARVHADACERALVCARH